MRAYVDDILEQPIGCRDILATVESFNVGTLTFDKIAAATKSIESFDKRNVDWSITNDDNGAGGDVEGQNERGDKRTLGEHIGRVGNKIRKRFLQRESSHFYTRPAASSLGPYSPCIGLRGCRHKDSRHV